MAKIYISGKISGLDNFQSNFNNAEVELISKGHEVINPCKLNHDHDKTWESYMKKDLIELLHCDEILMLKNWKESKGAIIEHYIALELGLNINYQL